MSDEATQTGASRGARAAAESDPLAEKMAEKFGDGGEGSTPPQGVKGFLFRGNVLDLAVAVIIGAAFGRVISSLVNDIIMPPIGLLLGGVDFNSLFLNLSGQAYPNIAAAKAAGAATINYGTFINTILDFLIVGFVLSI